MKLIIDIPEEVYNYIMRLNMCNMAEEYIKNGTPLQEKEKDEKILYWNLIEASNDNINWVKIKKFLSFKSFNNKKLKSNEPYKYWKITRW